MTKNYFLNSLFPFQLNLVGDQESSWDNDQSEESSKSQSKDHGLGQRSPENNIVSSNKDLWIPLRKQGEKIDIQSDGQWNQS
jgi:hypothetical protein